MTDLNALREQAAEAARKYQEELARAQREGAATVRQYVARLNDLYLEAQEFASNLDMSVEFIPGCNEFSVGDGSSHWNSSNC